ncbi:MAG: hypothetical protein J6B34_04695 [Clostridia bacterium]|nr:hypothetical protein [Clostridia bacterium]
MKDKFKLSEEEINQGILLSPYSLPTSPAERGLSSSQIKKHFYHFIRFFADALNNRLSMIGEDCYGMAESHMELKGELEVFALAVEEAISSLETMDTELLSTIDKRLNEHNTEKSAHTYIQEKMEALVKEHNLSGASHSELRDIIRQIGEISQVAYMLSTGRQKITPLSSVKEIPNELKNSHSVGDLLLILEKSSPDLIVFDTGKDTYENAILLDSEELTNGNLTLTVGQRYICQGYLLISVEGDLEVKYLAKRSELDALSEIVSKKAEQATLDEVISTLNKKESSMEPSYENSDYVLLKDGVEHRLGLRTTITLLIPTGVGDSFCSIVTFRSGSVATSIDFPSEIIFTQDDCYGGVFYPLPNRIYEISIRATEGVLVAKVGACDYEVIE